ncbi:ATP-grasp fold amidoligase family protein, partial [Helicobacter rappini]
AIQNLEPTQNTPQNPIPNQATQNLNSLLAKDSLLFQPIDTLTQELFNTNSCPYLPKLYGIYKSVDEIDFSKLPQSFVLKTNHDCGGVVLVKDKDTFLKDSKSFNEAMTKLITHLNTNFYTLYREWHYKDIEPRIFVEEMLLEISENGEAKVPENYRMFCFAEKIFIQVDDADYAHTHKRWFYDEKWTFQHFSYNMPTLSNDIAKPKMLHDMQIIAKHLTSSIGFVRVDLYATDHKVIVGELTFTPVGGTGRFTPQEWDRKLGELWQPNPCKQYEACANNLLSCSKSL